MQLCICNVCRREREGHVGGSVLCREGCEGAAERANHHWMRVLERAAAPDTL